MNPNVRRLLPLILTLFISRQLSITYYLASYDLDSDDSSAVEEVPSAPNASNSLDDGAASNDTNHHSAPILSKRVARSQIPEDVADELVARPRPLGKVKAENLTFNSQDDRRSQISEETDQRQQTIDISENDTDDSMVSHSSVHIQILPQNIHENFPLECGADVDSDVIPNSVFPLFEMVYGYRSKGRNGVGHRTYTGPMKNGVELVVKLQICSYNALEKFWELANANNITRWSAHGGTLMGAHCHSSINPWDDDIDMTVASCDVLERLHREGKDVEERYPDMNPKQHTVAGWEGKLLDDDWILIRGPPRNSRANWYKLKSVNQITKLPARDLAGMDIMCFDKSISDSEKMPMKESGFEDYLKGDGPLQVINYGPSKMKLVPPEVVKKYVKIRYGKDSFCDFPLAQGQIEPGPKLPRRASQLFDALSKWHISEEQRKKWLSMVGEMKGKELTPEIPNLNSVEIDNTIANPSACSLQPGQDLTVIDWNAERGTHWGKFADMIESKKPDVIILNEMDIGMARSGNIHTTRKLAFRLGMNYAWGVEFVELTNGNHEEQNATKGLKNAMGLHGNAILSTCPIYDPLVVRDTLNDLYFSNRSHNVNAGGSEKRLGGRMALFVRTGPILSNSTNTTTLGESPHIVVSSVHKVQPQTQQDPILKYLYPGSRNSTELVTPLNTLGIVAGGDLESRQWCKFSGLKNLDKPMKPRTFPASCKDNSLGLFRGDYFCGNMKVEKADQSHLPCYKDPGDENAVPFQISDHSIIEITLKTNSASVSDQ